MQSRRSGPAGRFCRVFAALGLALSLAACGNTAPAPGEPSLPSTDTPAPVVAADTDASTEPLATPSGTPAVPALATATPSPSVAAATIAPSATPITLTSPTSEATATAVSVLEAATPTAGGPATPVSKATKVATPPPQPTATLPAAEQWEVRTLLAGPGEPGRLYALQADSTLAAWPATRARLLVSDDYGENWSPFPGGLPPGECVVNVNLDYAQVDALYASTCQGLYRWSGSEWALLSPQQTGMVAVVYGDPQVVWATTPFSAGAAVIRSADGGATWTPASTGLTSFGGVANLGVDPRAANTLYAIIWPKYAGSYLRRGTSQGLWQMMPTPDDDSTIETGMTIDGATGALYVTLTFPQSEVWRSSNPSAPDPAQVGWELVHTFGRDARVDLLASGWSPSGLALYANIWPVTWQDEETPIMDAPVVHRSLDGGQTWAPLPIP